MPPRMKQVTVLYGEHKLQTTFKIRHDIPHEEAKKTGEAEIRRHLRKLEQDGVMPHIELDSDCTDFFPIKSFPNVTATGEPNGNISMIVWPAADSITGLTPSPMLEAYVQKTSELQDLRSKIAMESLIDDSTTSTNSKKKGGNKNKNQAKQPEDASISDNSATKHPSDELSLDELMRRIIALEAETRRIPALEAETRRIPELEAETRRLRSEMTQLRKDVFADRAAINKIRLRILLDLARDKLATFCGFQNWEDWKGADSDVVTTAKTTVPSHPLASQDWKDLAQHSDVLNFIVSLNWIRLQGNMAAHEADESHIAESIFSLPYPSQDRKMMTTIFTTYYGHPPVVEGLSPIAMSS